MLKFTKLQSIARMNNLFIACESVDTSDKCDNPLNLFVNPCEPDEVGVNVNFLPTIFANAWSPVFIGDDASG